MEKREKILLLYLLSMFSTFLIVTSYISQELGKPVTISANATYSFSKVVNVDKNEIFKTMADITNYPKILPGNYVSVKMINQTGNATYSEEELAYAFIHNKLNVKHIIIDNQKHIMEVLNGDAQGTTITETYEEINSSYTRLTTNTDLHVHGLLTPFALLPKDNLEHATNTIIDKFVEYTKDKRSS